MKTDEQTSASNFLSIIDRWPEYFENMDEGLGTTYERFILHRYFSRIRELHDINSVLEAPSFGMTGVSGINSLWWANEGVRPVVLDNNRERIDLAKKVWDSIPLPVDLKYNESWDHLPFGNKSFDLSWNFAGLWFVDDLEKFLAEMSRITQKIIFICVPNRIGLGYQLRSVFSKKAEENFNESHIRPQNIRPILKRLNWKVLWEGFLDIPPWPDIAMKKEDLFRKTGLNFLIRQTAESEENNQRTCIVDYFNGSNPRLEKDILKYDYLEKAPAPIKQLWGHHRYFIFVK